MVNPGGTGEPRCWPSRRVRAHLPRGIAFMLVLPSVALLPCASLPNAYTRLTLFSHLFSLTRRKIDFHLPYIVKP